MIPYFFGYGSLVNRNTHAYPDARPARLQGWRRHWVRTGARDIVFLSVTRDDATSIDGLIAAVPGADWAALDAREYGYGRLSSGGDVIHDILPGPDIAHYVIAPHDQKQGGEQVILLSYLDVVIQGFAREYGQSGVERFFETTSGWDTPIVNDRAAPRYPRHQALSDAERGLVDHHLSALSACVE